MERMALRTDSLGVRSAITTTITPSAHLESKIGSELETLNAERNAATEAIAKLKRSGGDASAEIEKTRSLGDRIKELQAAFDAAPQCGGTPATTSAG